jgi:hypothetical protein
MHSHMRGPSAAATALIVIAIFAMRGVQPADAGTGNCGNGANYISTACIRPAYGGGPWGGISAAWTSLALNIAQCTAAPQTPGCPNPTAEPGFIAQALWYYELTPFFGYIEIGDSGGLAYGNPRVGHWERWWYWVDGENDVVSPIQLSPSDGSLHYYEVQWVGGDRWEAYLDFNYKGAVINFDPPSSMTDWEPETGLEVHWNAFSPVGVTNSSTFEDDAMQVRQVTCCQWINFPGGTNQVDSACPYVSPCLNGVYGGPGYNGWRNNKPN